MVTSHRFRVTLVALTQVYFGLAMHIVASTDLELSEIAFPNNVRPIRDVGAATWPQLLEEADSHNTSRFRRTANTDSDTAAVMIENFWRNYGKTGDQVEAEQVEAKQVEAKQVEVEQLEARSKDSEKDAQEVQDQQKVSTGDLETPLTILSNEGNANIQEEVSSRGTSSDDKSEATSRSSSRKDHTIIANEYDEYIHSDFESEPIMPPQLPPYQLPSPPQYYPGNQYPPVYSQPQPQYIPYPGVVHRPMIPGNVAAVPGQGMEFTNNLYQPAEHRSTQGQYEPPTSSGQSSQELQKLMINSNLQAPVYPMPYSTSYLSSTYPNPSRIPQPAYPVVASKPFESVSPPQYQRPNPYYIPHVSNSAKSLPTYPFGHGQ